MPRSLRPVPVTITFLEMTARPARPWPRPVNLNIAQLQARDIPLHFYRYLQWRVGKNHHWEYRLHMEDERLAAIVHAETTVITVLYLDGAPAGFFEIDRKDSPIVDLAYFGLMPHATGRGLGRWFLGQALERAWETDPQKVTVNTNTIDHPAALRLYQQAGFSPVRQADARIRPLGDTRLVEIARSDA